MRFRTPGTRVEVLLRHDVRSRRGAGKGRSAIFLQYVPGRGSVLVDRWKIDLRQLLSMVWKADAVFAVSK